MKILVALLVLFGFSEAIDLSGCRPSQPKVIQGLQQLIGAVTSPGYPEGQNYPENLACQYTIVAPYGFRIKLQFTDIDIEAADMCGRDALEFVEISNNQPRGLGVFCGNQTYPPIVTQGNAVALMFRSDFMRAGRGFKISYTISGMPLVCPFGQIPCKNRNCYSQMNKCDGKDDCGDGTDEERCGFIPVATTCGLRDVSSSDDYDRVIGGKEAQPGSWPWQADLQLSFIHPNGHACGGTLINAQWVLSAAHCFEQFRQPGLWRIHLGNHHKFKKDPSEQVRYGERIILYPGTTGDALLQLRQIDMNNDIALLKLNAPIKFTKEVRPACLPTQGYEIPEGTRCMATGWGMTRGTGAYHALKEVDLTIQNAKVCDGLFGPINPSTMICVKNSAGYQDVCHGDSGGPLVCLINNKWDVMGATSRGTYTNFQGGLCAVNDSSTVYSKVSPKTTWINQQINQY